MVRRLSLDSNPMEHLWGTLKWKVDQHQLQAQVGQEDTAGEK